MKHLLSIIMALLLAGCGGRSSSPPPAPPPPSPPFSISISPSAPWILRADANRGMPPALSDGSFDFPVCAPATAERKLSACGVGYIEYAMQAILSNSNSISMTYTITGSDPVFSKQTNVDNTCDGPATIRLWLHIINDPTLANLNGRWFSVAQVPLAIGTFTLTADLHDLAQWTPIYSPAQAGNFSALLAGIGGVGFGFGGGCFAMHQAIITSGTARFTLNSFAIQ